MFVARFLPGLRTAVFLSAGMSQRVSFARFIALDGLAATISVPVWIALGYYGAENREWLLAWVHRGQGAIAIAAIVLVVIIGWLFWRRRRLRYRRLRGHLERRADRGSRRDGEN